METTPEHERSLISPLNQERAIEVLSPNKEENQTSQSNDINIITQKEKNSSIILFMLNLLEEDKSDNHLWFC